MKILNFIVATTFSVSMFAQIPNGTEIQKDSAYIATYNTVRELYIKFNQATMPESLEKYSSFLKKVNYKPENNTGVEAIMPWVRNNIEKTSFKNIQEAEQEWANVSNLTLNAGAYLKASTVAEEKYGQAFITDIMLNRGAGDKDPKEEPEYVAASLKLKGLLYKRLSSKSYIKWHSLITEFNEKANFDPKRNKAETGMDAMQWVRKNLNKTMFISIGHAEMEWDAIGLIYLAEKKENTEYHTFQDDAIIKYGPEIYTDALTEVMFGK